MTYRKTIIIPDITVPAIVIHFARRTVVQVRENSQNAPMAKGHANISSQRRSLIIVARTVATMVITTLRQPQKNVLWWKGPPGPRESSSMQESVLQLHLLRLIASHYLVV